MDWKELAEKSRKPGDAPLSDEEIEFLDSVQGMDFEEFIIAGKQRLKEHAERKPMTLEQLTEAVWSQSLAIQLLEQRVHMLENTLELAAMTIEQITEDITRTRRQRAEARLDPDETKGYMN